MILTGSKIKEEVLNQKITISPFVEVQVNPNSYDFCLGKKLKIYKNHVIDPKKENATEEIVIPNEGFLMQPSILYLGHTEEIMGSHHYVPIIRGRSSIGRIGLFIHITADLIDIGSVNQWTLQMHCVQPVRIYSGMRIGQVTFWKVKGKIIPYNGKYQGSRGPMSSQIYRDFKKKEPKTIGKFVSSGI